MLFVFVVTLKKFPVAFGSKYPICSNSSPHKFQNVVRALFSHGIVAYFTPHAIHVLPPDPDFLRGNLVVVALIIRDCYEAFVVYSFLTLILEHAGGDYNCIEQIKHLPPVSNQTNNKNCWCM